VVDFKNLFSGCIYACSLRSPVRFSITQNGGSSENIAFTAASPTAFASDRFRSRPFFALEYSGHEHQMRSKWPCLKFSRGFHALMWVRIAGWHLASTSSDSASPIVTTWRFCGLSQNSRSARIALCFSPQKISRMLIRLGTEYKPLRVFLNPKRAAMARTSSPASAPLK
jgi:hypothetical protein